MPKSSYGTISTQEQDQRQGKYRPHRLTTKYEDFDEDVTHVKCLKCGQEWEHARGMVDGTPEKCERREENAD